jgi:hypothetical protein
VVIPANASALGRVVLAFSDEETQQRILERPLQASSPQAIVDPAQLRRRLASVRQHYYEVAVNENDYGIATLAAPIDNDEDKANPAVVNAVVAWDAAGQLGRALYFTRATAPTGGGPLFHHVGLYAYRREALESFVALPPSPLEQSEKLEQLRALEAGMRIAVARVEEAPLSVHRQPFGPFAQREDVGGGLEGGVQGSIGIQSDNPATARRTIVLIEPPSNNHFVVGVYFNARNSAVEPSAYIKCLVRRAVTV